jgi:hypothetical protein
MPDSFRKMKRKEKKTQIKLKKERKYKQRLRSLLVSTIPATTSYKELPIIHKSIVILSLILK